jgi:hypothetical protein
MAVIDQRKRADHLAKLVKEERQRHGVVEANFVLLITGLQQQVTDLNEQLDNVRSSFIKKLYPLLGDK